MSTPTTVIGPAEADPCPYCGATSGVQVITDTPPKVRGWSCAACRAQYWISVVNPRPQPYLNHLAGTVDLAAARSALREVITLANEAAVLSNNQLRARLADLATAALPGCRRG